MSDTSATEPPARHPDRHRLGGHPGQVYLCITLLEVREARIWREIAYWAEPFEAPDWRRPYVEDAPGA